MNRNLESQTRLLQQKQGSHQLKLKNDDEWEDIHDDKDKDVKNDQNREQWEAWISMTENSPSCYNIICNPSMCSFMQCFC